MKQTKAKANGIVPVEQDLDEQEDVDVVVDYFDGSFVDQDDDDDPQPVALSRGKPLMLSLLRTNRTNQHKRKKKKRGPGRPPNNPNASAYDKIKLPSISTTQTSLGDVLPLDSAVSVESAAADKPREERPYTDYFPGLPTTEPIRIQTSNQNVGGTLATAAVGARSILSSLSNFVHGLVAGSNGTSEESLPASSVEEQDAETLFDIANETPGPVLHPKHPETIPVVEFTKVTESPVEPIGEPFKIPEGHYLRYAEPSEEELATRVEYDMDEQDLCWLGMVNEERRVDDLPEVSEDLFEQLIDLLEKEWFHLTKDLNHGTQEPLTHEESVCNICHDGEVDNSNAIVFCDGCNMAVHQECYGVPYIPEGQWLCRKCMVAPEKPVSCIFCPNEGGAFKQTTTNKWAHLLCALWIPEVSVANPVYMEPIEGVEKIPKSRWKLTCSICKKKTGACIQCCKSSCCTAFHVTCARKAGLYMKVRHYTVADEPQTSYKVYCRRHAPSSTSISKMNIVVDGDTSDVDVADNGSNFDEVASVTFNQSSVVDSPKKPTKKGEISQSTPIAPEYIVKNVLHYLEEEKISIRQKQKFVCAMCKYWALKRKSRRGAPLLKRLHLEPWTMFSSSIRQNEAIQLQRFRILSHLRNDLENVRLLAELVRKREKEKLRTYRLQLDYLYMTLAPLNCLLRRTLDDLKKLDVKQYFWYPVTVEDVPDYFDVIKQPMCFSRMLEKIEAFEYETLEAFEFDLNLICNNALIYNKPDTIFARLSLKIKANAVGILDRLRRSYALLDVEPVGGHLMRELPPALFEYQSLQPKHLLPPPSSTLPDNNVEAPKSSALKKKSKSPQKKDEQTAASPVSVTAEQKQPKKSPRKSSTFWDIQEVSEDEPDRKERTVEILPTRTRLKKGEHVPAELPAEHKSPLKRILDDAEVAPLKQDIKRIKTTKIPPAALTRPLPEATRLKKKQTLFKKQKPRAPHVDAQLLTIVDALKMESSTDTQLGWAKISGFPWFPAEIIDIASSRLPENIRETCPADHIVGLFFDRDLMEKRTWFFLPAGKACPFDFGDKDGAFIREALKKSTALKKQILTGYLVACLSRSVDPNPVFELAGLDTSALTPSATADTADTAATTFTDAGTPETTVTPMDLDAEQASVEPERGEEAAKPSLFERLVRESSPLTDVDFVFSD